MTQVTVRFAPSPAAQTELQRELARVMQRLKSAGVLQNGHVEAVFPGDETDRYKGTFVVTFNGAAEPVTAAFSKLPGVRTAYAAPDRSSLAASS